ncbi:rhodanese-like domain-containing protein [Lysinibacillus contaminans]|uniref:rhodanese-like domain-containing protein n=1 Tax=Lysinibacillus contaminans TaxID=1293441 RepID=UPI0006AF6242|nr:rhodanese-like domain-containing protein [Lysinibacillus contaminans]
MQKIFISLIALLLIAGCSNSQESFETIDITTIEDKVADGWKIVDVREVEEFENGHIPNAINVPLSSISQGEHSVLEQDQKYIVICQSGNRSQKASEQLHKAGFQVLNVKQGMGSWTGDIVSP